MSLLARLSLLEPTETWPRLHSTAMERYWDGLALATGQEGRRLGAIYLLGYVAEIVLKVAFFRVCGLPPYQAVSLKMATTHASWRGLSLHDVNAWAALLIEERRLRGRPFEPVFASQLKRHVMLVTANWREALRYRHSAASEMELVEVFQGVDWLLGNSNALWS